MLATISERGNGFPDVGDYVPGDDGELYRVESITSRIHTAGPGAGNYLYATLELADWSDVESDDDDVFPAQATTDDPAEEAVYAADRAYDQAKDDALTGDR